MTPLAPILVAAVVELWLATQLPLLIAWLPGWAGLATGWVAVAYVFNAPQLLGKLSAPRTAALLLLPVRLTTQGSARLARRFGVSERAEVVPGLWVGAWPRSGSSPLAHVDVTAELPRRVEPAAWRCFPMLDGAAPRLDAWQAAVEQALACRREGREVLVHCAYGQGRSVAVVLGVLVAEGHFPDLESAYSHVRSVRPRARLTAAQRQVVERGLMGWRVEPTPRG